MSKKIKDTLIAGKLPDTNKLTDEIICKYENWYASKDEYCAYKKGVRRCLNTELDINELVEVDVEKLRDIIFPIQSSTGETGNTPIPFQELDVCQAIAKAGILKWKE